MMEKREFALDPALGMLIECDNYCGDEHGARLKMVDYGEAECTRCGEIREFGYGGWTTLLSLKFTYGGE